MEESGIEDRIHRQYAWSRRGKPIVVEVKGKRTRRVNLIVGLLNKQLLAPCVFNSYINSECFNYWLENHLLKELSPGYTIIIDNARFHKSAKTRELVEKAQSQLVFLPPDLNPIEKWWDLIKARVKNAN